MSEQANSEYYWFSILILCKKAYKYIRHKVD